MTLQEIRTLLAGVDPEIRHYYSEGTGADYTYWEETRRLPFMADDRYAEEAWRFYVHRYTRSGTDQIANALFDALDQDPRVAVSYSIDYDPQSGYIHHIYECECI